MAGWALPAAAFLGSLFASRGNGGSEFSDEQKQLFGTQADLAEMMKNLYASRIANEERYMGGAMDRVFGYVDESLGRAPDLLHAPGIFEFMPKTSGQVLPDRPAWAPYAPGAEKPTEPKTEPKIEIEDPVLDPEDATPITEIVPPVDVGAIASMLPAEYARILSSAMTPGEYTQILDSGPGTLEEALGLEEGVDPASEVLSWIKNTPEALADIEEHIRRISGADKLRGEKGEALDMRGRGSKDDPTQLPTYEISTTDLIPPGDGGIGGRPMRIGASGEVLGPVVPEGGTPLELPTEDVLAALQARGPEALSRFTQQLDRIEENPRWREERNEAKEDAEIEAGEFTNETHGTTRPIIELTDAQRENLMKYSEGPGELNFEIIERDGKFYLRNAVMGDIDYGWFGTGGTQSEIPLHMLEQMLDGTMDMEALGQRAIEAREENRFPDPPTGTLRELEEPGTKPASVADLIWSAWNTTTADPNFLPEADLNADGIINALDLGVLADDKQAQVAEKTFAAAPRKVRR